MQSVSHVEVECKTHANVKSAILNSEFILPDSRKHNSLPGQVLLKFACVNLSCSKACIHHKYIYIYINTHTWYLRLANELLKAQRCSKVLKLQFLQSRFDVFRYLLIGDFCKFTLLDLHTDSRCHFNHWSQNASCGSKQRSEQPP